MSDGGYVRFKDLRPGGPRDWVDEILDQLDVPFAQRSEVREFASMDQSKQLVWLYVQSMRRTASARGVTLNALYTTAIAVGYAILTILHGSGVSSPFGGNGSEGP